MKVSMVFSASAVLLGLLVAGQAFGQNAKIPAAIYTDPVSPDIDTPARNVTVHIPAGDVKVNGVFLIAAGKGPHPTTILLHGLPGNEKNLDLAQAVRRAGWNVLTFNYRGSWGSPGAYSFKGDLEDAASALDFVRDPANVQSFGIDTKRIVMMGHSVGGWVAALTAAKDTAVAASVLISPANMGEGASMPADRPTVEKIMLGSSESIAGTSPEKMAEEVLANRSAFDMRNAAKGLASRPLLLVISNDIFVDDGRQLLDAIGQAGGKRADLVQIATDHNYSSKRISLESTVIDWLGEHSRP